MTKLPACKESGTDSNQEAEGMDGCVRYRTTAIEGYFKHSKVENACDEQTEERAANGLHMEEMRCLCSQQAVDSCILLFTFLTKNVKDRLVLQKCLCQQYQSGTSLQCLFTTAGFNLYAVKLPSGYFFKYLLKSP